jgi:hypothetical protein
MPRYIVSATKPQSNSGSGEGGDCCCPSTTRFFQNITDKLLKMTKSLKEQFEELKKQACNGTKARGAILAEIDAPVMTLGVKMEYIEYIRRFGPPDNGVFEPCKLEDLRKELGIEDY